MPNECVAPDLKVPYDPMSPLVRNIASNGIATSVASSKPNSGVAVASNVDNSIGVNTPSIKSIPPK